MQETKDLSENLISKDNKIKSFLKGFCEKVITFYQKNTAILLACLVSGLVALIFGAFLCNKALSPAEGWYSYYAYLINVKHQVPYVDFEILFPPLYVYCIAFYTKIFGYSIIALRILGVFIYMALSVLACLIFYKVFGNALVSSAVGILTFAFLQSEVAQISYDYIRFMDLSVYISVLAFVIHLKKDVKPIKKFSLVNTVSPSLIVSAVFAVFASLFKQSSGLIYLIFVIAMLCFIFLSVDKENKKRALCDLIWFIIIAVSIYLAMFLILLIQGGLGKYFYYNFKAASGSKGGVFTILFGNFIKVLPDVFKHIGVITLILVIVIVEILLNKFLDKTDKLDKEKTAKLFDVISICVLGVVLSLALISAFTNNQFGVLATIDYPAELLYWPVLIDLLVVVTAFVGVVLKDKSLFGDKKSTYSVLFLSAVAFCLAYAVCMSGGLCQSQVALCVGVSFAIIAYFAKFAGKRLVSIALCALLCFLSIASLSLKITTIYSWWGLAVDDYWAQTEEVSVKHLQGLKFSEDYAEMYQEVTDTVNAYKGDGKNVFAFPHIPIFYLLTETDCNTYTKVQWFDVSADKDVVADIEILKNNPPDVFIYVDVPEWVVAGHEGAFRKDEISGLSQMKLAIMEIVSNGYTAKTHHELTSGYTITVYVKG